jgi:hypothetical protein
VDRNYIFLLDYSSRNRCTSNQLVRDSHFSSCVTAPIASLVVLGHWVRPELPMSSNATTPSCMKLTARDSNPSAAIRDPGRERTSCSDEDEGMNTGVAPVLELVVQSQAGCAPVCVAPRGPARRQGFRRRCPGSSARRGAACPSPSWPRLMSSS